MPAMKRSSGSAAQPADFASDRSTEQPADQTADDNSKRRKCDEQAKSASDAHPGDISTKLSTSTSGRASGSAAQPTSSPGSAAQPASSLAAFTQC